MEPNLGNSGADGQASPGLSLSRNINLKLSNSSAAIIFAVFLGITAAWSIISTVMICCKQKKWIEIGPSSIVAMLAAATGLSAAFLDWPQAQQNSGMGVFVTSQAAGLGYAQTCGKLEIFPRFFDTAAVVFSILTVITTSHRYDWETFHNPTIYCYGSVIFLGTSLIVLIVCRLSHCKEAVQKISIFALMVVACVVMCGFAIKATTDMILPYEATMSLAVVASVCICIVSFVIICFDDDTAVLCNNCGTQVYPDDDTAAVLCINCKT